MKYIDRSESDGDISAITPVNFFHISADCKCLIGRGGKASSLSDFNLDQKNYKTYLLPDTSFLCSEESFAEVAMGWSEEGIEVFIIAKLKNTAKSFRQEGNVGEGNVDFSSGDCVEIFIDTRDVKTATFNTRFCHHFVFRKEVLDGKTAAEVTHFRTEDTHPLCDPDELQMKCDVKSSIWGKGYSMNIFIPKSCLVGYDSNQFKRLGFSYRINRCEGFSQHFSVVTDDYQIDQQPSLWSSINLVS